MRTLWLLLYDLKTLLRDRRGLALLLLVPAVMALAAGYGLAPLLYGQALVEPFAVAVVDREDSYETRLLIHHLAASPGMARLVTVRKVSAAEAERLLAGDEVAAVLEIPPAFVESMTRGTNLPLTVTGNPRRPLQAALVRQLAQSGADLITAAQSGVITVLDYMDEAGASDRELNRWYRQTVADFSLLSLGRTQVVTTQVVSATGPATPAQYYAIALAVTAASVAAMSGLWNIRGSGLGMLLRLRSIGLSNWQVCLARMLVLTVLQLPAFLTTAALTLPLFLTGWQGHAGWALLMVLAVALANAALLVTVSVVAPTLTAANLVAMTLILLMALAGGSLLPAAYLPQPITTLGIASVNRWAVQGLVSALVAPDLALILPSMGALLGGAVLCGGLSVLRLRWVGR